GACGCASRDPVSGHEPVWRGEPSFTIVAARLTTTHRLLTGCFLRLCRTWGYVVCGEAHARGQSRATPRTLHFAASQESQPPTQSPGAEDVAAKGSAGQVPGKG